MKISTQHLKDVLQFSKYRYLDVVEASPFTLAELESKNRQSEIMIWRQFVVAVARVQGFTLDTAGKIVNQNHATVMHSMKAVYLRVKDKQFPEYQNVLNEIRDHIEMNLISTEDVCLNELNCMVMLDQLIGKKYNLCAC
jgi:hypothetical protein